MLVAVLAGCTGAPAEEQKLQIRMDQTSFILKKWNTDGSHRSGATGQLVMGDKPVANAVLHVGESKRNITTKEDGSFEILLDQSLLGQTRVEVASLEGATVEGKPIPQDRAKDRDVSTALQVQYPIVIESEQVSPEDPEKMIVQGRIIADKDVSAAYFKLNKFQISGILKDADGKPVQGAAVWFDRDEDTYLTVTTNGNTIKYTLLRIKCSGFRARPA